MTARAKAHLMAHLTDLRLGSKQSSAGATKPGRADQRTDAAGASGAPRFRRA